MVKKERPEIFPLVECNKDINIDLVNLFIEKYAETDEKTVTSGNIGAVWAPHKVKQHDGLLKYIKGIKIPDDLEGFKSKYPDLVTDIIKCAAGAANVRGETTDEEEDVSSLNTNI